MIFKYSCTITSKNSCSLASIQFDDSYNLKITYLRIVRPRLAIVAYEEFDVGMLKVTIVTKRSEFTCILAQHGVRCRCIVFRAWC